MKDFQVKYGYGKRSLIVLLSAPNRTIAIEKAKSYEKQLNEGKFPVQRLRLVRITEVKAKAVSQI